jgi:hypothetical protein
MKVNEHTVGNGAAASQGAETGHFWEQPKSKSKDIDMDKLLELNKSIERQENTRLEREKLKRGSAGNDPGADGPRKLIGRTMATVQMRAIDWLWTGWIPKGYVTIWAGETGAGKSTALADVVARESTGQPWPGETDPREPGRVLWLGSEDGAEDMTVPRLVACGADLSRITEIQGVMQADKRSTFSMQDDLAAVRAGLGETRQAGAPFTLLVIDPVTSYLPGRSLRRVDMNDAGQLRSILEPWLTLAQEFNLAIVCVTHFNKNDTRSMLHRVLGSAAFAQTCRSLCGLVARPEEGAYEKTLIQVKVNLPDHPGGAWRFQTVRVEVGKDSRSGKPINATRVSWQALDRDITPESIMGGSRGPVSEYPAAFGPWLRALFLNVPTDKGLAVSDVKAGALIAKVVSAQWWDNHSAEYLDKQNIAGTWMCRPK